MTGDLLKRQFAAGEKQDERKFRRSEVNHMTQAASLSDATYRVIGDWAGKDPSDLRTKHPNFGTNFDCAAVHFRKRAEFNGMSEAGILAMIAKANQACADGYDLCESPIEKLLLPWLVMEDYGPKVGTFPAPVYSKDKHHLAPKGDIVIIPQLAFIRVRIDFAIVSHGEGGMRMVAVECDGEAFHNAKRDMLRDGFLASFGIPTIRASGSEITTRPRDVSVRASVALQETLG